MEVEAVLYFKFPKHSDACCFSFIVIIYIPEKITRVHWKPAGFPTTQYIYVLVYADISAT